MGWMILGVVLGGLGLILGLPIQVCLHTEPEPTLTVRVGVVPVWRMPSQKEPKVSAPKRSAAKAPQSDQKPNLLREIRQADGVPGVVRFLKQAIAIALRLVGHVARRLVIERLDLRLVTAGGDSAETAVLYGKTCAALYPAVTLLSGALHYEKIRVTVVPDFMRDYTSAECRLRIRLRLVWPVWYGLQALVRFLRLMIRQKSGLRQNQKINTREKGSAS